MTFRFIQTASTKPGYTESDLLAAWEEGNRYVRTVPGFIEAIIHRRPNQNPDLAEQYLLISVWDSPGNREAGLAKLRETDADAATAVERMMDICHVDIYGMFEEITYVSAEGI